MEKFSYSFEERESIHEGGIPLPPQPSCGGLQRVVIKGFQRLNLHLELE
jgi:hypothetical protein